MASDDDTAPPGAADFQAAPPTETTQVSAPPAVPLPRVIGGKYRVLRLIARGGMGAVYEVEHLNTGEHLALKVMLSRSLLTPDLVARFRKEARVHSSIKSDHVVRIVDADVAPELDEAPFLVMELLDGQDFERLCLQRRPSPAEVVDWMRQLAAALDRAHIEGIVHRDLKPENLFLATRQDGSPIVKILDFGVAKIAEEGAGHSTATGQILGTPRYMAPEQATAAKEVTPAADRFALGLIAFRLLSGRHYFQGESWIPLLREVARGPRSRPSELGYGRGRAFDAWFAKACALEPRRRFATCAEQVEALAHALQSERASSRPGRVVVLLGAAAMFAVVGWRIARRPHEPAPPARATIAAPSLPPTTPPAPAQVPPPPPTFAAPIAAAPPEPVKRPRARPRPAKRVDSDRDRTWNEP